MTTDRQRSIRAAIIAALALVVVTASMLAVRSSLDKAHVALVLLLVVLGASAAGGRIAGLSLAAVSFVVFNWFFLEPYNTLVVANPLDWVVLLAFLITSVVAAQLLFRAQREARHARERADEIDRIAVLGAETISAGRAEDALTAIAQVIREGTGISVCEIYQWKPDGTLTLVVPSGESRPSGGDQQLVTWVATSRRAVAEQRDGTTRLHEARPVAADVKRLDASPVIGLLLPLEARGRNVGVLRVADDRGLSFDAARWRFLDALSYYAALGVERVRLVADAERVEALREADRLKDALLAAVSHDLRTPLTTIKALAHDLRGLGDERAEVIEQEVDRLNRTVADLLALSQLNAGVLPAGIELNALDDLLGALVQRVEPALHGRTLDVSLPVGEPLLLGRFDLVHSLRVLVNLVENAAKYAPGDTPIAVIAVREKAEIAIRVSDRGPGIPADQAARMFEPFYRPADQAPDVAGTGLGLSIARRLAELQDGSLTYEPRPGGGSDFTFRLPAADLPAVRRES